LLQLDILIEKLFQFRNVLVAQLSIARSIGQGAETGY
jgi:hypothetical protein